MEATLRVSESKVPLAHETIPIMDVLHRGLTEAVREKELPLPIRHASLRAAHTLNDYYDRSDEADIARFSLSTCFLSWPLTNQLIILLVLHPTFKLQYFKDQDWPDPWIREYV